MSNDADNDVTRRTFLKASGVAAGFGAVGAGSGRVSAHEGFHAEFANWRVREAKKVWERGYRGRPDRSVAMTDSGIDVRHPDLGPWNGVRAVETEDGMELREVDTSGRKELLGEIDYSGLIGPGVAGSTREEHPFTAPGEGEIVASATLSWTDNTQIIDLILEDDEGNQVAAALTPVGGGPVSIQASIEGGEDYVWVVETFANAATEYRIEGEYTQGGATESELDREEFSLPPGNVDATTPKTVGWTGTVTPQDTNGHGSHVASIMSGSGRASHPDPATVIEEEPRTVLTAGETLEYEIEIEDPEGRGVFGAAYGDGIEVILEAPNGEELERGTVDDNDSSEWDSNLAVAPTTQSGTHRVYVRAAGGELLSTGRVESVSAGALLPAGETPGDRTADGDPTVQAGVAPNAGLVGLQGLGDPFELLARHADWFAETFNVRTCNMSWGGLPNERTGTTGRYEGVERIAEGGILTVSSAGNNGPLSGPTGPSGGSEAIATVSTGPLDGLVSYTSGGTVVRDDDGDVYRKPDVAAPGGTLTERVQAADIGDDPDDPDETVRGYTEKAGTSMAAPYANGVAGLVAEAMEFDAPDSIALPAPGETDREDVLRLKQVLLATASETAFTAAPYHRAHVPTYEFGGRDSFEGFGRVNPDAAVDAVTRELSGTTSETVGLNVPDDARAVAGYVDADPGVYEVSIDFSHLSGGNKGMAKGDPHIDLFVYDAEEPADNGEPNVVAKAQGLEGDASVQFTAAKETDDGIESGTYVVVAKLVNVPGVVNGYDVQAHFDLSVEQVQDLIVTGTRTDDGTVFTGGQTDHVRIEVSADEPVIVRDVVPADWDLYEEAGSPVRRTPGGRDDLNHYYVYYDPTDDDAVTGDDARESASFDYFVEAPEGSIDQSDSYEFGPVEVSHDGGDTWIAVPGTADRNYVIAQSQP